jgi:hypothetical protein
MIDFQVQFQKIAHYKACRRWGGTAVEIFLEWGYA